MRIQTPCKIDARSEMDPQEDCCKWSAVVCDQRTGNVILLNLYECTGDFTLLPDSPIFELRYLQELHLSNSSDSVLNCSIPHEIHKLSELRELRLYGFAGPIPSSIGNLTKLQELSLTFGRLSGTIPPSLGNLRELTLLSLQGNDLSGSIPPSLGNLRRLTTLILRDNNLTGTIPQSFANLTQLEYLSLQDNSLSGALPFFLFELPSLVFLYLGSNRLEGVLPQTIRPDSNLTDLALDNNNLTGDVLASLCNVTELDLSFNSLDGVVRWDSSRCFGGKIERVNLSKNKLHGSIPDVYFPMLRVLLLNGNNLGSKLPRSLGRCTDLSYLDVGNNNITDVFPRFLGAIPRLYVLIISSNNFFGDIARTEPLKPSSFPNLVVFDGSHNSFTGLLPLEDIKIFDQLTYWKNNDREVYGDQIFITFKGAKSSIGEIFGSGRSDFTSLDLSNNMFTGEFHPLWGK